MTFFQRWARRFGLPESPHERLRHELETAAAKLPFIDAAEALPLLEFLFGELPGIVVEHPCEETPLLAEAYAWCCYGLWQCESAFPAFPENYAAYFRAALGAAPEKPSSEAVLLARMIVEFNAKDGQCGFNRLALADAATIRESESITKHGQYEIYLKAQEKYDEYLDAIEQSAQFQDEWHLIKLAFPKQCAGATIIRRSLIPERNWERGPGAEFATKKQRFQATFDLFCWKYFLWGMKGDQPYLGSFSSLQTFFSKKSGSGSLRRDLKMECKPIFKTCTGAKATGLRV